MRDGHGATGEGITMSNVDEMMKKMLDMDAEQGYHTNWITIRSLYPKAVECVAANERQLATGIKNGKPMTAAEISRSQQLLGIYAGIVSDIENAVANSDTTIATSKPWYANATRR